MVQFCSRCQRGNPDQATFCYFDGIPLRKGAVAPIAAVAPGAELVFPSGRRCRTLDDLVQSCQAEWDDAGQLLQQGELTKFLQRLGRADLVHALAPAANAPPTHVGGSLGLPEDPDVALYNFLNLLPARNDKSSPTPRLDLQPRRISLKKITVGERPHVQLTIVNQGRGVLQGKIMISAGQQWLRLVGGDSKQTRIMAQSDQQVALRIDTRVLVGGQVYVGRLTVITNGGIAEVPVKLDLAAVPFGQAPYKGATTPRGLAQRMLTNPKPAVSLLENGEVSRWFAANGWNYPVAGEPARGVAAVQQFFECLGLSRPPPLTLSDSEVRLHCLAPAVAAGQVTLSTNSKKWVFAQAECDAPWLRVTTPSVSGPRQTRVSFEVDSANLAADQVHQTALVIRANGNLKLSVRVKVEVQRPAPSLAGRWLRPILVGAVLALVARLLLAFPADFYARLLALKGPQAMRPGTLVYWQHPPGTFLEQPLLKANQDFLSHFVLATWWVGGVVGFLVIWKKGGHWGDRLCGVVAGCGAGVGLGSVLACLLILLDGLPRLFLAGLSPLVGESQSAWLGTTLWLGAAALGWAILGGALGLALALCGRPGLRLLGLLAAPAGGLCRLCRLDGLGGWFMAAPG